MRENTNRVTDANRVYFFDTTLRDGEQSPGVSLQTPEKVEIAQNLVRLGVDVIEAGFPAASPGDFEAVNTIAKEVKGATICALARANKGDIEKAAQALEPANDNRLHMFIATSDIHLEYKLKKTREEVIQIIKDCFAFAAGKFHEIEFSAEDASRTDLDYLCEVFSVAIEGGATILNVPDTVGYMTPDEFGTKIRYIKEHVRGIEKAVISVHCHDDLGLANANTLAAIQNGARQVECTVNGLGERAGNVGIEEVVMALHTRRDVYGLTTGIDTKQFTRVSKLISRLTGMAVPPNKAIVGANAFAHESGIHQHGMLNNPTTYEIMTPESVGAEKTNIVLGKHSGRHAFESHLETMGFTFNEAKINDLFAKFKALADRKKEIFDEDILALVIDTIDHKKAVELVHHHYHSNERGYAYADVRLATPQGVREDAAVGDGAVDASLKACERVIGLPITLKDYEVRAVTEGQDALGAVRVTIEYKGKKYNGRGVSTDVILSSVMAYINAVNYIYLKEELDMERIEG
ncbi:MAG: 2-isopropylmalate synthase [Veillonella sp.]|uniref:2-isopropylmalate synthase n=1 Tax=Veillonella sp. TaxID=1926307 RepID=UPI0025E5DAAE|nr:2-isopropylmalate synthase [Veillonella sp.]MBS4913156.1 2-isopropylmalate synthase [Veillonella sp.]